MKQDIVSVEILVKILYNLFLHKKGGVRLRTKNLWEQAREKV